MLFTNLDKKVSLYSEHLDWLVGVGVVEIGVLVGLVK